MKVFVPEDNTYNKCYVVQNDSTIRAYNTQPNYNTTYSYREYFVNSHYLYRDGSGAWGNNQYSSLPTCISSSDITHNFYYRNDLSDILLSFFIIVIVCFWFPFMLFRRFFGRWFQL